MTSPNTSPKSAMGLPEGAEEEGAVERGAPVTGFLGRDL
ncbi:hypothetical protein IHE45_08G027600 [Dioscorea alata]|uniref:Uncharacterized protein n=1 Tax=Dioscorea alata TaxID=55571 RepID=A0ACB7VHU0_DIOAL|nr:hypothetical protein IHE45_08G027600 [Dioscorea alata]